MASLLEKQVKDKIHLLSLSCNPQQLVRPEAAGGISYKLPFLTCEVPEIPQRVAGDSRSTSTGAFLTLLNV